MKFFSSSLPNARRPVKEPAKDVELIQVEPEITPNEKTVADLRKEMQEAIISFYNVILRSLNNNDSPPTEEQKLQLKLILWPAEKCVSQMPLLQTETGIMIFFISWAVRI